MFRYALARSWSHFVDNFLGVLVEELIHGLAYYVVAVQLVGYAESGLLQFEIDQQTRNSKVADLVPNLFLALHSGDSTDVNCNFTSVKSNWSNRRLIANGQIKLQID